jgi:nonribosomal peptide synthetase MxcG
MIGNRIKAFVVPLDGNGFGVGDIEAHCRENLPRYMIPEAIEFRDWLPKTSSGKVDRPLLARN